MPGWVEVTVGLLVVGSQLVAHIAAAQKKKQAAAALAEVTGKAAAAPQAGAGTAATPVQKSLRGLLEVAQKRQTAAKQARLSKLPAVKPQVQTRSHASAQATANVPPPPASPSRNPTRAVVPAAEGTAVAKTALRLPRNKRDWVIASEVLGRPRCESF